MNKDFLTPVQLNPDLQVFRDAVLVSNHGHHHALDNGTQFHKEMEYHLHWMCPVSCALLTAGLLTNVLSIGVFKHTSFDFMKLPVFLIVACTLSILLLVVSTLKIFSAVVDYAKDLQGRPQASKYHICIYIGWVNDVLLYVADINVLFAVYNRIKSQRSHDLTSTKLKAMRIPVISLMATCVLSIVPASLFNERKWYVLGKISQYRCSHYFVYPYDHSATIDVVIAGIHTFSEIAIFLELGYLCILIGLNAFTVHKKKLHNRKSSWFQSMPDGKSATEVETTSMSDEDCQIGTVPILSGPSAAMRITIEKPESVFKDYNFSWIFVSDRDASMTKLTMSLALAHVASNLSSQVVRFLNGRNDSHLPYSHVTGVVVVEMIVMTYHAFTFLLFVVSSKMYRGMVWNFLFERAPQKQYYADMALARRMDIVKYYQDGTDIPEGENQRMSSYLIETFNVTRSRLSLGDIFPSTCTKMRGRDKLLVRRRKLNKSTKTTWL